MHMCVKGNDFVSLCHFFFYLWSVPTVWYFLDFWSVPTVWYFFLFFWSVPTVWYFLDFWSVPTVWYFFLIFEVFRQCGIFLIFEVFRQCGIFFIFLKCSDSVVFFFIFLKCSNSVVFICFSFYCSICWNAVIAIMKWYMQFCCVYIYHRCRYFYYFPRVVSPRGYHPQSSHCFVTDMVYQI
jgi:hypothetical protein